MAAAARRTANHRQGGRPIQPLYLKTDGSRYDWRDAGNDRGTHGLDGSRWEGICEQEFSTSRGAAWHDDTLQVSIEILTHLK
jgi:hypothetical protein